MLVTDGVLPIEHPGDVRAVHPEFSGQIRLEPVGLSVCGVFDEFFEFLSGHVFSVTVVESWLYVVGLFLDNVE